IPLMPGSWGRNTFGQGIVRKLSNQVRDRLGALLGWGGEIHLRPSSHVSPQEGVLQRIQIRLGQNARFRLVRRPRHYILLRKTIGTIGMIALPLNKVVNSAPEKKAGNAITVSYRPSGMLVRTGLAGHPADWQTCLSESCHRVQSPGNSRGRCEGRSTLACWDFLCIYILEP